MAQKKRLKSREKENNLAQAGDEVNIHCHFDEGEISFPFEGQ